MWNATLGLVRKDDRRFMHVVMNASFLAFTETLSSGDLATLVNELHHVRAKWYDLGIQLRMETSHLDAIETQHHGNPDKCQRQMLSNWLKTSSPPPTWQRVVDALCSPVIDKNSSAECLRHIYCNPSPARAEGSVVYLPMSICHIFTLQNAVRNRTMPSKPRY